MKDSGSLRPYNIVLIVNVCSSPCRDELVMPSIEFAHIFRLFFNIYLIKSSLSFEQSIFFIHAVVCGLNSRIPASECPEKIIFGVSGFLP